MSILVANIGNSDISIKVGNYYLPLEYRDEPNLELPSIDTPEYYAWRNRSDSFRAMLQKELGIDVRDCDNPLGCFREISAQLVAKYSENPEHWHPRISIGRIQGVIQQALSLEPQLQAYLIVTDQPISEKHGYPSDTIHAFDVIKLWLEIESPDWFTGNLPKLTLRKSPITFKAIEEDRLFNYYQTLFQDFDAEKVLYVSVKGGTPQMQTALKIQAIASDTKTQIFLSPKPVALKILLGEPSECVPTAYWRYQQGQAYREVQLLLQRWDFDGAAVLLKEWLSTLDTLIQNGITGEQSLLKYHHGKVEKVVHGLELSVAHLNLDIQAAKALAHDADLKSILSQFNLTESIFAQCKIYFELERISHFLSHLGSFFDVSQENLVETIGSEFPEGKKRGNRFAKRSFIRNLIEEKDVSNDTNIKLILENWTKLDFWYEIRNQLIHGANGINKDRLKEVYKDRLKDSEHLSANKRKACKAACTDEEILLKMQEICTSLSRINQTIDETAEPLSNPGYYGLYGQIREWAIATLKS